MVSDKLCTELNNVVLKQYENAENGSWQEDNITAEILKTIKNNMEESTVYGKIEWNICKYVGQLENTFGDIAFLIKLYFTQDKYVEGVHFIEAKKFDFLKDNYSAIKFENLENYVEYSQSHSTILYTINEIDYLNKYNNILTLPTQHLISLGTRSKKIEQFTLSFESLLDGLFYGKSLDYREEQIEDAKGFVSNTGKKFKYIVNIAVPMASNIQMEFSNINSKIYQNFSDSLDDIITESKDQNKSNIRRSR